MKRSTGPLAAAVRIVLVGLVPVAILLALAWKAGARFDTVAEQLGRLNLPLFAGTLVFSALWHTFLGADKWWRILRAQGANVGFWEVFRVRMGSDPIRFTAPLKAGEAVNVVYFAKRPDVGFSRAAGSIVFDKALNFFGAVFWLYVGVVAMAQVPTMGYVGLHSTMGAMVLVLICVRPARQAVTAVASRLHPTLDRLATGVLSAFEEFTPFQKIGFLLYGIVFQLRPLAVCALFFVAIQPDHLPSLQEFLGLGSVVVLMSNIPSLGGIGPREATLMVAFSNYADPATLLSVGLLMSFAVQVVPAILGIPMMFPLMRAVAGPAGETIETADGGAPLPTSPVV